MEAFSSTSKKVSKSTHSRHQGITETPKVYWTNSNLLSSLLVQGPLRVDECEREYGLSCPVKVLKITEYGGKSGELKRMKHLLEKLSCLELVKVRARAINDKEKSRLTKDLLMVPRSSKCNIQIKFSEKTK